MMAWLRTLLFLLRVSRKARSRRAFDDLVPRFENVTRREMQQTMESPGWAFIMREVDARLAAARDDLERCMLLEGGKGASGRDVPRFETIRDQDMYLKGAAAELRWLRDMPSILNEIWAANEVAAKEQQEDGDA